MTFPLLEEMGLSAMVLAAKHELLGVLRAVKHKFPKIYDLVDRSDDVADNRRVSEIDNEPIMLKHGLSARTLWYDIKADVDPCAPDLWQFGVEVV